MSSLYILWDESHLWGLLAWRAIHAMGFDYRLVRGEEIAQGALSGKGPPAALIVPGGVARRKAERLGPAGMAEVQRYMDSGGAYLGFCGGSGLGLTGEYGLDLCPWTRAAFKDRMMHLVSGHVHVQTPTDHPLVPGSLGPAPLVPVWWPARFAAERHPDVEVLARYTRPGADFWVADLPLESLPTGTLGEWEATYGVTLGHTSMKDQPCVITGKFGNGRYLLSYAHLETPDSPQANQWLAHILCEMAGQCRPVEAGSAAPAWDVAALPVRFAHPLLLRARHVLDEIIALGREHFLLFPRNSWLMGWRAGIPGAHLNHLYSLLCEVMHQPATDAAERFLDGQRAEFSAALERFHTDATGYLLAERLAMTLSKTFPDAISQTSLREERNALFGRPMEHGGLYAKLLNTLDETAWLLLSGTG